MLKINNLTKLYEKKNVIKNLNLELKEKTIFGLVGINGAGKSTILRLISGVLIQDQGEILINGEKVLDNQEAKKNLFFLPDDPYYTNHTTGNSLVKLYEAFYDFNHEVFKTFIDLFKLDTKSPIHTFSKGMRRQLYISIAIATNPKLLLLDEAFDGLDPKARLIFKRALIKLVEENNTTVIISSHSLRELEDICDSFGLLDGGYFKTSGIISETLEDINKYQMAFKDAVTEDSFKGLNPLNLDITGRVVKMVLKGKKEDNLKHLENFKPLFVEIIPIDFEELFIYEIENGDSKWENTSNIKPRNL